MLLHPLDKSVTGEHADDAAVLLYEADDLADRAAAGQELRATSLIFAVLRVADSVERGCGAD